MWNLEHMPRLIVLVFLTLGLCEHQVAWGLTFNDYTDGINRVSVSIRISSLNKSNERAKRIDFENTDSIILSPDSDLIVTLQAKQFKRPSHRLCISFVTHHTNTPEVHCISDSELKSDGISNVIGEERVSGSIIMSPHLTPDFAVFRAFVQGRLSGLPLAIDSVDVHISDEAGDLASHPIKASGYTDILNRLSQVTLKTDIEDKTVDVVVEKYSRLRFRQLSKAKLENKKDWSNIWHDFSQNFLIDILIFSKDRPSEADSLIQSLKRNVSGISNVYLLYSATSKCTQSGYLLIESENKKSRDGLDTFSLTLVDESDVGGFRKGTLFILSSSEATHFVPIVSESVAIRPHDLQEAAAVLHVIQPNGVFQLRLGNHMDAFRKLEKLSSLPKERKIGCKPISEFIVDKRNFNVNDENKFNNLQSYILYNSISVSQNVCDPFEYEKSMKTFLNHFWWTTHVNGLLIARWLLLKLWGNIFFSHPGELEVAFGYTRQWLPALALMPVHSWIVAVGNMPETRPDHLIHLESSIIEASKEIESKACLRFVEKKCRVSNEHLDFAKPNDFRMDLDIEMKKCDSHQSHNEL